MFLRFKMKILMKNSKGRKPKDEEAVSMIETASCVLLSLYVDLL